MDFSLPQSNFKLGSSRIQFLNIFKKSCISTILRMLETSQAGHPGGSLSSLDFLSVLYAFRISHTNEPVVISNGHISPGVYSVLAECGAFEHHNLIRQYRQFGSIFEGHVTRHVPGIWYGTGPLGVGVSAAAGIALGYKKTGKQDQVFALIGDGECQEGQVHEMMLFAAKYKLNNLTVFVDYNRVQLSSSLEDILPIHIQEMFEAGQWHVVRIDGHDPEKIWQAIQESHTTSAPTLIIGHTIMGHGVPFMENDGRKLESTWHGKAPSSEQIHQTLPQFQISLEEQEVLESFRQSRSFHPVAFESPKGLAPYDIEHSDPRLYTPEKPVACRKAYGNALLDLAQKNKNLLAETADLGGSVKTNVIEKDLPQQHIEYGIAEQNMVSCSGGLSFSGIIPFCSTFGAFMTSRAKDQARVNDINQTNVKMVSTHCGLSVGTDGPTHQAIDDMGSFMGFFHTYICEPADANHCDRIIRYVASHYGNFYVRMGRHPLPILTKKDGTPFYDTDYVFTYGKTDIYREGTDITIVCSGSIVQEVLEALEKSSYSIEVIIASSPKDFDETLLRSIQKTKKVITVEDHNPYNGLGAGVLRYIQKNNLQNIIQSESLGVQSYQLSGTPKELYHSAGISASYISNAIQNMCSR